MDFNGLNRLDTISYKKYRKSERRNTYMKDPRLLISVGRNNNRSLADNKRSKEITSIQ